MVVMYCNNVIMSRQVLERRRIQGVTRPALCHSTCCALMVIVRSLR